MANTQLAIISTHPIQYYAPLFQLLAKSIKLKVFYTWGSAVLNKKYDPGFNKNIEWDIPLLENYDYHFTKNISRHPGSHHFNGIINPNLIHEIKAFNPTCILIYGYNYHSHLKIIKHFSGKIPLYFRGDSTLLDKDTFLKLWVKKIYLRWVYGHFDKVFYVGNENKRYFKYFGVKENRLIFAPHAVDNVRFQVQTSEPMVRKSLGIPENDVLILFAGKLEPKKNPMLLIKAFEQLNSEKVSLLMVGNGILESELKMWSKKSLKSHKIFFQDFKNQSALPSYYQSCDIFCLPSIGPGETWGLAINEAMATGKAIIASDKVGCASDLIQHKKNGYVFISNDINDLVNGLNLIIKGNSFLKMGELSKKIIDNYTIAIQAQRILNHL